MCAESTEPCGCFFGWVSHLVHAHRAELLRLARREGLSAEDAFDCVQEAFQTFLILPQARSLVEDPEASAKLLVTVARNVARNRRRRHATARPHGGDEVLDGIEGQAPPVDELIERAEDRLRVLGCVQRLQDAQRAVVTLRMLDERPGEDVAELLGLAPGHVAVLLHRAKQQIRSCMLEDEPAPEPRA
jgi:RNA polymerase sigma-70 factor (ECF subfamily)